MLKEENIKKYKKKYENNKQNKIMQRMLNKVQLVDLIQDSDTKITNEFNIEIKTHRVTDQKASARCWSFAELNILREKVIEKCNLDNFELSGSYISFYDRLERFNMLLERLISYKENGKDLYDRDVSSLLEIGITDGGSFTQLANLIKKYGIVPNDIFPETFQSSNAYEINQILSRLLRKFYLELQEINNGEENKLKDKYMQQVYTIVATVYGIPKETFDFEYTDKKGTYHIDKNMTPKEFYDKYINIDLQKEYIEITTYSDEKIKLNKLYQLEASSKISGEEDTTILNLSSKDFQSLIIKQLKSNEPVYFYCSTTSKRIDGIWVDLIERYGEMFDIDLNLDRNSILKTNGITNCHAMLITGAHIIDDKVVKYKVENSWGSKYGNNGYYIATDDWLKKYVYRIVINKKNLNKNQLEILKQGSIKVDKYDAKF